MSAPYQLDKEPHGSGIIGSLMLDGIFFALEEAFPENKTKARTFILKRLLDGLPYNPDIYPCQDKWVFNYIEANYSFEKIKGKSPEDNILKKELAFINALMDKIKDKTDKFSPIISLFVLYIFNEESHFLDAVINLISRKEFRLYPLFFTPYI